MKITIKVAAIILNKNGEVLLIKEEYEPSRELKWNLVKGTYDDASETIADCIKREIKEEVGLTAREIELKKIYHYGPAENRRILFVFLVNKFNGIVSTPPIAEQKKRAENIAEACWMSPDDIQKIPEKEFIAPYVCQALKNIGNLGDRGIEITRIDDSNLPDDQNRKSSQ